MVKFWFVEKFFSDNLLASLTKLVAAAKLENHVKIYYFHNQHTGDSEFHRFQVLICINRLRVHDATIQWTYVGSLQALTSFSTFADTRNILVVFSECDRTPDRGPDFCFFTLTCFFTLLVLLLFLCHLDSFDCHVTDTLQLVKQHSVETCALRELGEKSECLQMPVCIRVSRWSHYPDCFSRYSEIYREILNS